MKKWKELTDAEKGILLLAQFNGRIIQFWDEEKLEWDEATTFVSGSCYRVKPIKPFINWSHVSEQYQYLATDSDGSTWLFDKLPEVNTVDGCWYNYSNLISASCFASLIPGDCNWKDSLVKRPQ